MSFSDLVTSRFTFGARFNDPQPVSSAAPSAWFAAQLKAPSADDPAVASRLAQVQLPLTVADSTGATTSTKQPLMDLTKTPEQLWAIKATDSSSNSAYTRRPADEVIAASWIRGAFSPWQLQEVMVDFWHNHFSVDAYQTSLVAMMWPAYDQVLRANALGNFRAMLGAVAKSASMMYYLNQAQSYKAQPNENFAREVMELHTLGIARYLGETPPLNLSASQLATAGYSDADVTQAARILTGWTIADGSHADASGAKPNNGDFIFSPSMHSPGAKVIFGTTIPEGGQNEGESFLDMLAAHPGTANTIATKLYVHFVSDVAPANSAVISQMAQSFQANVQAPDQIPQLLTILFNSADFAASAGQKIKMPFPYLVSLIRISGAEVNPQSNLTFGLSTLGAPLFQWPTPNGMPDIAAAWTGTNDMLRRWALAAQVTAQSSTILVDGPGTVFAQIPTSLSGPQSVLTRLTPLVLGNSVSSATQSALATYAATPEVLGGNGVLNDAGKLLTGVRSLVGAMACTPEFQSR
jgi:uncharacterized protein (DUF1800 family)